MSQTNAEIEPPASTFLRDAYARGYIHQTTDRAALDTLLSRHAPVVAYAGYDCTGDSLHVGHLLSIMQLRLLQSHGHKPIVLMGGGTTKVGDPSGKDEQRRLLDDARIEANKESIKDIFRQFLTFGEGPSDAVMVDNADWLDSLNYIAFLREYGRFFSVNRMLGHESVRQRLDREQPLSFLEFNYMVLQAYDFLELYRRHGCRLQLGGSDQWGNIVEGIELTQRVEHAELHGVTCPLLTTASGQKMGKTADGAVWLNERNFSSYAYYQFWRNTEDADVGRFLRLFTELPLEKIARLENLPGAEINEAKKVLAHEATKLCRGEEAAERAAEAARKVFEQGQLAEDLPRVQVERERLAEGVPVYALLRESGLADSNGAARRLIKGGGARVNDEKVGDPYAEVTTRDMRDDGAIKLSAGKKKHALVTVP